MTAKESLGWTFVFLGAGLDAYVEGEGIGYAAGSVQAWAPDAQGARAAFTSLSRATTAHRQRARRGDAARPDDFFEGDKAAEDDWRRRGH